MNNKEQKKEIKALREELQKTKEELEKLKVKVRNIRRGSIVFDDNDK